MGGWLIAQWRGPATERDGGNIACPQPWGILGEVIPNIRRELE
jgi:hypothetical protein